MRWELTHRSEREVVTEVGTPNQDRPGSTTSRADTEVMERADPMNMSTITAASRVMGVESTATGTEDRTESTPGMGVHRRFKGTHPTLSTPKTDSSRSEKTMLNAMDVCQADSRECGKYIRGKMGNSGVTI